MDQVVPSGAGLGTLCGMLEHRAAGTPAQGCKTLHERPPIVLVRSIFLSWTWHIQACSHNTGVAAMCITLGSVHVHARVTRGPELMLACMAAERMPASRA